MAKLEKKIALVTGGAKGIGRAIALKLALEGAYVVINYRGSIAQAEETLKLIEQSGGNACIKACDISDFSKAKSMIEEIISEQGRIDILVNNAGITKDGLLMGMTEEMFDLVINANLKGTFNCMQTVTRAMIKQRYGRIVNISSVSGVLGNAGQANYSASKAGIIGLTKATAKELATRNITVNAVAPGFIDTDMTKVLSDKVKENILSSIPMNRMGSPTDIANTVAFLASDDANYITGQVLSVDGGMA